VKEHLRDELKLEDLTFCEKYDKSYYENAEHLPNKVMKAIFTEVQHLYSNGTLSGEQLLNIRSELQSFTDNLGVCERIRKTPIPYSYSLFLKKIIFLYVFSMPIGFSREFGFWSMPIVSLIFYVFGSIELLAEEIEDPFGTDANDLPTDQIHQTISKNLKEIMDL
jgi:putative membrane protein